MTARTEANGPASSGAVPVDSIEEAIGRLSAMSIGDVTIKLTLLCERLRADVSLAHRYDASSFVIAQCALEDLRRLAGAA